MGDETETVISRLAPSSSSGVGISLAKIINNDKDALLVCLYSRLEQIIFLKEFYNLLIDRSLCEYIRN